MSETTLQEKEVCSIQFNFDDSGCWYFYKFIKALSNFSDEVEFTLKHNELEIRFMDPSRIMLASLSKHIEYDCKNNPNNTVKTYALNLDDLTKLTRVRKRKNAKNLILRFYDNDTNYIVIEKTNKLETQTITKTLALIDITLEEIPMDNLLQIEYPSKFSILNKDFEDVLYELGDYAEIVKITANRNGIEFFQDGQIGKMNYPFSRAQLIELEVKDNNNGDYKGAYSLSFLDGLKPFFQLLDKNQPIHFKLNTDHPLALNIDFDEVGFTLDYFLAPRVEEVNYEYDEDGFRV